MQYTKLIKYSKKNIYELSNNESDNMVNGVIYDSTALVVNDDNFHKYFDENGYLNYTFDANKTKVIFFTLLAINRAIFYLMLLFH